jgi:hypothetical protein
MLRKVANWMPEPLASIVPATPDDRTWVVDTGRPKPSATPIVARATIPAAAPWPQVYFEAGADFGWATMRM